MAINSISNATSTMSQLLTKTVKGGNTQNNNVQNVARTPKNVAAGAADKNTNTVKKAATVQPHAGNPTVKKSVNKYA